MDRDLEPGYAVSTKKERWEIPMKKLVSLFLASLLSLSLLTSAFAAPVEPPEEPDPTPIVTIQPIDPEEPEEPPVIRPRKTPDPEPVEYGGD